MAQGVDPTVISLPETLCAVTAHPPHPLPLPQPPSLSTACLVPPQEHLVTETTAQDLSEWLLSLSYILFLHIFSWLPSSSLSVTV